MLGVLIESSLVRNLESALLGQLLIVWMENLTVPCWAAPMASLKDNQKDGLLVPWLVAGEAVP